jgi:GPH family glycoside/pentoside/hexuronide:cation symporter
MASAPLKAPAHGLFDKLAYGFGSIAFGVKDNGFSILLMLFYNQALGLSASSVGFAIMVALLVDAICDPLIGNWTDSFRSRLGRRHPFMYAAALPVSVSYFFLWHPPGGMSHPETFIYLITMSIFIRICISFYEIPSSALVVDLSRDYDERTSFLSYRYFFGWVGGLTMGIAAFSIFLRPSASDPSGQLNLAGYANYGLTASLIMFSAIVISSLGTQRHVASFAPPPEKRPFIFARSAREAWQTLANKPFGILALATFFSLAAIGIGGASLTYFRIYFWELSGDQISFLMVGNFASIGVALFFAPKFARRFGKKLAAITLGLMATFLSPAMYLGRLLDVVPANHTPQLYWMLFSLSFIDTILGMSSGIIGSSMLADVVEHAAARTGRHAAGLLFSANAFLLKAMSGIGVFGSQTVLHNFAWTTGGILLVLSLISVAFVSRFPITRAAHQENLRRLDELEIASALPAVAVI